MVQPEIILSLLVLGSMLMAAAAVACFVPRLPAALVAYMSMIACGMSNAAIFTTQSYVFWGIATALSLAITYMLPVEVAKSRLGVAYIGGGAIVGMVLGMLLNTMSGIILGAALGSLCAAIAFARTPAGHAMQFPSSKFFNYFAAKALPVIVTMSMIGASLIQIIS